jgi:hypothetical protein
MHLMKNMELKRKLQHLAVDNGGNFMTLSKVLGVTHRTVWNVSYGKCSRKLAQKIYELSKGAITIDDIRNDKF